VYNQPWADGRGEEAVALDYAPWFFGGFGAAHGLSIATLEYIVKKNGIPDLMECIAYVIISLLLCIVVPVLGFIRYSIRTHGHPGTRPVSKE
jgi:hypothetical protein